MVTLDDLNSGHNPLWCPGCGNFGVLNALKSALSGLGLAPERVVLVSGIGCSGKTPHFVRTYGVEAIHGRVLPVATGVRLVNPELTVIGLAGDGDGYGIGMGHFVHAMRRNLDITYIVHNNHVYGLTTGQTSPTSPKGFVSNSTPHGVLEEPVNPLALALASGATFVARGYAGELKHLESLFKVAIEHKGFSLVDVLQPCVSFDKGHGYDWYAKRVYKLEDSGYKPDNLEAALNKALEFPNPGNNTDARIPIGLFYQTSRQTYEEQLPQLKQKRYLEPLPEHGVGIQPLLKRFE